MIFMHKETGEIFEFLELDLTIYYKARLQTPDGYYYLGIEKMENNFEFIGWL